MKKLNEYLSIKEAADILGVNPATLRSWEKAGKLKTYRNPINNYRMYKREDLEKFLNNINKQLKNNK